MRAPAMIRDAAALRRARILRLTKNGFGIDPSVQYSPLPGSPTLVEIDALVRDPETKRLYPPDRYDLTNVFPYIQHSRPIIVCDILSRDIETLIAGMMLAPGTMTMCIVFCAPIHAAEWRKRIEEKTHLQPCLEVLPAPLIDRSQRYEGTLQLGGPTHAAAIAHAADLVRH